MLHNEERKIFAKIFCRAGICHYSDFFISLIQSLFSSTRLDCLVWCLGRRTRPKDHTYKDHVYLNRLFLLSNLTWRRTHVTAGLTGRDPRSKCRCKCFAAFSLRTTKSLTLICIYGDSNAIHLLTSRKKSRPLFCFRDTFARRVLVYQDEWFVSVSDFIIWLCLTRTGNY